MAAATSPAAATGSFVPDFVEARQLLWQSMAELPGFVHERLTLGHLLLVLAVAFGAMAHIAAAEGRGSQVVAQRLNQLRQRVRKQAADGRELELMSAEQARREVSRLRGEVLAVGDCDSTLFALRWSPWGTIVLLVQGALATVLDLLEALGGRYMFWLLVNLGLRHFCGRASLPYNTHEIAARQGLAAFNRERSFSWRVVEPDGSTHEQRIVAIGCDHGEMWVKVENAWAKIYVQHWMPRVPVAGIVVYLHDYASYSGEVAHLLPQFLSRGLAVISFDMRGHGRSSGIHGLLPPTMQDLDDDLQLVLDTIVIEGEGANGSGGGGVASAPPPLFLMGTSFGALCALHFTLSERHDREVHGVILQSPLFTVDRPYSQYNGSSQSLWSRLAAWVFPAWPMGSKAVNLAADPEFSDQLTCDRMRYHGKPRAGSVKVIADGTAEISQLAEEVHVPILIQQGASDVSHVLLAEEYMKRVPCRDKKMVTYKAAANTLLFEDTALRTNVTDDAVDWIENHLSGNGPAEQPKEPIPSRKAGRRSRKRYTLKGKNVVEPDGSLARAKPQGMRSRMTRRILSYAGYPSVQPERRRELLQPSDSSEWRSESSDEESGPADGVMAEAEEFLVNDEFRDTLPPVDTWHHRPVLVRCSPDVPMEVHLPGKSAYGDLPINDKFTPIPFETPLFKGVAMIRVADLPSSPAEYFTGRRRKMQIAVQGKFKRPLRFDQVFSGQEFSRPLCNIPGRWLIKWALSLLRSRLPDTFQADAFARKPYFLSPLISTSQAFRADTGTPQPVTDNDIVEDNRALGPDFADGGVSANARKKYFVDIETLKNHTFDPAVTYTFDYYQQFFRAGLFALDLGVRLLDLAHYVGKQPLLLTMAKTMDTDEYLWKFELWHEKLLRIPDDPPRRG